MSLLLFLPETVVLAIVAVLLIFTLLEEDRTFRFIKPFMTTAGFAAAAAALCALPARGGLFYSTYRVDLLSQTFKCILSAAFCFTLILSFETSSIRNKIRAEYFLLLATGTLGMMMLVSAVDMLTLYISLELSAYSLYLLSALKKDNLNAEASVKYLVFGAATSGVFLWGLSLIAGLAQTTSLIEIAKKAPAFAAHPAFALGLLFVSFSFLFKLSGFPFHFWAPDVYERSATPVTNFIATASKAAAVAILIRVFLLAGLSGGFVVVLGMFAFISMILGNTAALVQKDVKRLLAYSSIAQAGYLLLGLLSGSSEGYSSSLFYAMAYVLMNTGAFLVTALVARWADNDNPQISDFDGLAEKSPFSALVLLLSLLSLAGIPPLVGFVGKWILFSSAMEKGHWFLVLWAVLNSVVSLFYYLILVKHAYLEKPKTSAVLSVPVSFRALGLFLSIALVLLGVFPNFFISLAQHAIFYAGQLS